MTADRKNPGGTRETGVGATHASPLPGLHNLKPYSAYKDSGVPWLGEVPAHWEVRRVRSIVQIINGATPASNRPEYWEGDISWLTPEDLGQLPSRYVNKSARRITNEGYQACGTTLAPARSLAISTRAPIGHLGILSSTACVNQGCRLLVPTEAVQSEYLYYELEVVRSELESLGQGSTFTELSRAKLAGFALTVPPIPEQTAIVRFLDHADRRIQRYTRAKQKLIALLEEQKQAIIHQTVTGQIDLRTGQPYPAYKPSGVEWLGDVPVHWQVAALRHRYSQCLGKMLDSKRITGHHSLPYLRNVDVQWDQINTKDLPAMDIPPDEYERYTVQQGDLLVCEGGEVGRCALWSGELPVCGFQKALHRLRPRKAGQDVPRFLHYALRAAVKGAAFNDGHLSTIAHLTGDKLRAHRFPFPPVTEQESLVGFLDAVLKQADRAIARAERQIELLREYRTRLIADVVTGKLDVREAAATLPEVDPLAPEEPPDGSLDTDAA